MQLRKGAKQMLPCAFHVCVGTTTHALGGGKANQTELTEMAFVTFVERQNGRSRAGLNHQRQEQSHLSAPITSRSLLSLVAPAENGGKQGGLCGG